MLWNTEVWLRRQSTELFSDHELVQRVGITTTADYGHSGAAAIHRHIYRLPDYARKFYRWVEKSPRPSIRHLSFCLPFKRLLR